MFSAIANSVSFWTYFDLDLFSMNCSVFECSDFSRCLQRNCGWQINIQ